MISVICREQQLFDKQDSAKLKNQKTLNAGGEFLADNQFGVAVIVASGSMEGDTQKELVLTEARAMVVREYLAENFGFDDSQLKTLGRGKQTNTNSDAGGGTVQIFIYPTGTEIPPHKQPPADISPNGPQNHRLKLRRPQHPNHSDISTKHRFGSHYQTRLPPTSKHPRHWGGIGGPRGYPVLNDYNDTKESGSSRQWLGVHQSLPETVFIFQ